MSVHYEALGDEQETLVLSTEQLYWCHRRPPGMDKKREIPSQGSVPLGDLGSIPEDVREVLRQQIDDIESGSPKIVFPVRYYDGGLSHTKSLTRKYFADFFGLLDEPAEIEEPDPEPARQSFGHKLAALLKLKRPR